MYCRSRARSPQRRRLQSGHVSPTIALWCMLAPKLPFNRDAQQRRFWLATASG
jgi:hypothetical protein